MTSSKNYVIAALALLAAGAGFVAWEARREVAALRAERDAEAAAERDRLAEKGRIIRALQDQLAARAVVAADSSAPAPELAAGGSKREGEARLKRKDRSGWRAYSTLAGNAEFEALFSAQTREQVARSYGGLYEALNLSPERRAQLQALLCARQQAVTDAVVAAREQGISSKSKPAEFRKIVSQAEAEVSAEIQGMLGDTAYAAYQQYQETVPQRNLLSQLQEKAGAAGSPLSEAQKAGVLQIFAQVKSDKTADAPGTNALLSGGGTAKVSDDAVSLAKGVLTAPQLLALQQIQKEQQLQKLMKGKSSPPAGR